MNFDLMYIRPRMARATMVMNIKYRLFCKVGRAILHEQGRNPVTCMGARNSFRGQCLVSIASGCRLLLFGGFARRVVGLEGKLGLQHGARVGLLADQELCPSDERACHQQDAACRPFADLFGRSAAALDSEALTKVFRVRQVLALSANESDANLWINYVDSREFGVAASNRLRIAGVYFADHPCLKASAKRFYLGLFIGGPEIRWTSKRNLSYFKSHR